MAEIGLRGVLLLFISLTKYLEGAKLLAGLKKCGDLECETLISRVLAVRDYTGPDCRYLNFTKGEEIFVYIKLAGEREDLWAGSKGKDFGFFPRDAVQIEEVFISEEVQVSTKESDFLCLLGASYLFEIEDSEINNDNSENVYPYEEDRDSVYGIYESDFQMDPEFYATPPSTLFEDRFAASEAPADIRSASESDDWEEAGASSMDGDHIPEVDYISPPSSVPDEQGRFRVATEQAPEKGAEAVTEPVPESSFGSRTVVKGENDLEELNNGEPQTEHEHQPESELGSLPEDQPEGALDSEDVPTSQATVWFGGGFTSYLGFGKEDTGIELLSEESNQPLQDVPSSMSSDEEAPIPCMEVLTEKEDTIANDSSVRKPSWFDFGFGVLSFAYASEEKIISDDGENEENSGLNEPEHTDVREFDSPKEQEMKMIKTVETEDQTEKEKVFEKTDDSSTIPYLKKFLYNFDNTWSFENDPKETELPFPKETWDQNNMVEHDETEEFSAESYPTENVENLMMLESRYSQSDMISTAELSLRITEKGSFKTSSSKNNDEESKFPVDSEEPAHVEIDRSVEITSPDSRMVSTDSGLSSHNYIPQKDDASEFQILKYLFQIDIRDVMNSVFSPVILLSEWVVTALPEEMRPGLNPSALPWELVIGAAIVGFVTVVLFLWRSFCSVRSRCYVGREKQLAIKLSELIQEKCKLLNKVSLVQKECEGLECSLKDVGFEKESVEAQSLKFDEGSQISEETCEELDRNKSKLDDEIFFLEKELKDEESTHSEQEELKANVSEKIWALEDESKSLKAQVAEAKTTFKIFQINEERLRGAIKDAMNENSQLQESQKQLLQELEMWKEQVNELKKQKVTFEDAKVCVEQVLSDKDSRIKSLTEHLLKMKDWAAVLGEDVPDDGNLELDMRSESADGAHIDNEPKGALKKLIYAAKLNASLKSLEGERNQIYTQLSEIDKTKEEFTDRVKNLQSEQASVQSENTQLASENQKLRQKLELMTELYQENERKLHRKLTVEENSRLEKEEKLSKLDEKISYAVEELETYRKRAKDLEEELEKTIQSYQGQVISHEKKAHDNWLAARTAERNLNELRKENAYSRQKLTEAEFKFELLEKDPCALDVPNTAFGREHSSYGPSPLGRPSSETRAFLSPPTLLEGPLRLSPLLPGGGGRGSRGLENPLDHQSSNERGDLSYDRLTDPHRAPSDTGSLSPPWEQDRRAMIPPPGQPYPDPALPLQKQDRYYSNSGRLSGPAELRSYSMLPLDKLDGPVSSEMESSRNDTKDDPGNSNVPGSSLPAESRAAGPGFVPPPFPPRPPFLMYPRSQIMRRGPPFPPPPPGSMYGAPRDYFPPRDFSGPLPPFPMRSVYPPRGFPPPPLPSSAGFPPQPPAPPPPSESRSELPSGPTAPLPASKPAADHPEPQQET